MTHSRRRFARHGNSGFTLMEIILVVVIIMTLMAVAGPRLVGKSKKAKVDATKMSMNGVKLALQEFEAHAGRFPTSSEGLDALITKPGDLTNDEWPNKYMDNMPKDAWGTEFNYTSPSEHGMDFDLVSAGPDKRFGSEDDIANYDDKDSKSK